MHHWTVTLYSTWFTELWPSIPLASLNCYRLLYFITELWPSIILAPLNCDRLLYLYHWAVTVYYTCVTELWPSIILVSLTCGHLLYLHHWTATVYSTCITEQWPSILLTLLKDDHYTYITKWHVIKQYQGRYVIVIYKPPYIIDGTLQRPLCHDIGVTMAITL